MTLIVKQLINLIRKNLIKEDVVKKLKDEFIKNIMEKEYNNYSIFSLKKKGVYKTYYPMAKKICESEYDNQIFTVFNSIDQMADMIYNDVFLYDYELDGQGNIYQTKTNINFHDLKSVLNIEKNEMNKPKLTEKYDTEKIYSSDGIIVSGGSLIEQNINDVSKKYNSIEQIIAPTINKKKILTSVLASKLAYLDLMPRYRIKNNKIVKILDVKNGFLQVNIGDQIFNRPDIFNCIPYYNPNEERLPSTFFVLNTIQKNMGSMERIKDPKNTVHCVLILQWNDEPSLTDSVSEPLIVDSYYVNDFYKCSTRLNKKTTRFDDLSDVKEKDVVKNFNLGRINYYLIYDMNTDKFYLTLRGTNFGNADKKIYENVLSSSLTNIFLDLQIPLEKVRKIYHSQTTESNHDLLSKLGNYLFYVFYKLFESLKCIINIKPTLYFLGLDNTVVDILIYCLFGLSQQTIKLALEQIIAYPVDVEENQIFQMLKSLAKTILDTVRSYTFGTFLLSKIIDEEKLFNNYIPNITKTLHLFITKNYLQATKSYSQHVLTQTKHFLTTLNYDPEEDLIICGHSLGGGLMQYLCSLYNNEGYGYNPIGGKIMIDEINLFFDIEKQINVEINSPIRIVENISTDLVSGDTKTGYMHNLLWGTVKHVFNVGKFVVDKTKIFDLKVFSLMFPTITLEGEHLYSNVKNLVVSQDIVHKIPLSSDYNHHVGNLYICSIEKYNNLYVESYFFKTEINQLANGTMFHGINGFLVFLNKIMNENNYRDKHINQRILNIRLCANINEQYSKNFLYFPTDIKELDVHHVPDVSLDMSRGKDSPESPEESGADEHKGFDTKYTNYKSKYLKYKNKYLLIKNKKKNY
jgi:hypothetical protein